MPLTQEEYLRRFRVIIDQMFDLTSKKNHDYAREEEALANFKEFGAVGVLVRISDKFQRIKNALWFDRRFIIAESLEDTMMDLAVYAVIMLILYRFEREQHDLQMMQKMKPMLRKSDGSIVPLTEEEARAGAEQIDKNLTNYFPKSE